MTQEYSNKSDVWSFGVMVWWVLYEIKSPFEIIITNPHGREMIFAREPYEGWNLLELALKIRETNMHPDLTGCDDEFLKNLMLKCWAPVSLH